VTATAYFDFLKKTGLDKKIKGILKHIDVEDNKKLNQVAGLIQKEILVITFKLKLLFFQKNFQ